MTESVVLDDTNLNLHCAISTLFANNKPGNSSISLLTTQPDSFHQNQMIEYNSNQPFQDLLEEERNVYNNHIIDSTHLQYLSTNTALVIFFFKDYQNIILQPYADKYEE